MVRRHRATGIIGDHYTIHKGEVVKCKALILEADKIAFVYRIPRDGARNRVPYMPTTATLVSPKDVFQSKSEAIKALKTTPGFYIQAGKIVRVLVSRNPDGTARVAYQDGNQLPYYAMSHVVMSRNEALKILIHDAKISQREATQKLKQANSRIKRYYKQLR